MPKPDRPTAAPYVPVTDDLEVLMAASHQCRGCSLHENATQTVFGRGATAVQHFTFTPRGNRRVHATPDTWEVRLRRPWLHAELALVRPELVVLLGATAAKTVYGPTFRVTQNRGALMDWPTQPGPQAARDHPSVGGAARRRPRDGAVRPGGRPPGGGAGAGLTLRV